MTIDHEKTHRSGCFPKIVDSQHVVHVHVCHEGHFQVAELLGLRDYLRTHASEAEDYGAHKAGLAAKFPHDNIAYMKGKDALVKGLIEKAMQWRAHQGQAPKSQIEFWRYVLDYFSWESSLLEPEEVLFIDDRLDNIMMASQYKIKCFHLHTEEDLTNFNQILKELTEITT